MISRCDRKRPLACQGGADSRFWVFQGGTTHDPKQVFIKKIIQIYRFKDVNENGPLRPTGVPTHDFGYSRGARLTLPGQLSLKTLYKSNDFRM